MSKGSNNEDTKVSITTSGTKKVIIAGIAIILLIVGVVLSTKKAETTGVDGETVGAVTEQNLSSKIASDTTPAVSLGNVKISNEWDAKTADELSNLQTKLSDAYTNNALLFLIMGEEDADKVSQMYNKDYQCYVEWSSGAVEVYYDRGKSLQLADTVERVSNVTALDTLQGVLDMAKSHKPGVEVKITNNEVYENDMALAESALGREETGEDVVIEDTDRGKYVLTETIVSVEIPSVIFRDYYSKFGNDYAEVAMTSWDSLRKDEIETNDKLLYTFVTNNLHVGLSASENFIIDDEEYISWYFDDYYDMGDWSLNIEDWKKEHTAQEFIDMTVKLQDSISVLIDDVQKKLDESTKTLGELQNSTAVGAETAVEAETTVSTETEVSVKTTVGAETAVSAETTVSAETEVETE